MLKSQVDSLKNKLIAELRTTETSVSDAHNIASDVNDLLTSQINTGVFHHKGTIIDSMQYLVSIISFCAITKRNAVILCPDYKVSQIVEQLENIKSTNLVNFETNIDPKNINKQGVSVISYEMLVKMPHRAAWRDDSVCLLVDTYLIDSIAIESSVASLDLNEFLNALTQVQSRMNQLVIVKKRTEPTSTLNAKLTVTTQSVLNLQSQLHQFTQIVGATYRQTYCFQELLPRRIQQATKELVAHTKELIDQILISGEFFDSLLTTISICHDAICDFLQLDRQKWLTYDSINDAYLMHSSLKNGTNLWVDIQNNLSIKKIIVSPYSLVVTDRSARFFQYSAENKTPLLIPTIQYGMKDPLIELWIKQNLVESFTQKSTILFFSNRQLMHRTRIAIEQQCSNHQILLQVEGDAPLEKQIFNHNKALSLNLKSVILASSRSKRQLLSMRTQFESVVFFGLPFDRPSDPLIEALCSQCNVGENWFQLITLPRALVTMSEIITNIVDSDGYVAIFDKRMLGGFSYTLDVTTHLMESHQCQIA